MKLALDARYSFGSDEFTSERMSIILYNLSRGQAKNPVSADAWSKYLLSGILCKSHHPLDVRWHYEISFLHKLAWRALQLT
jgi:hypothetical protein